MAAAADRAGGLGARHGGRRFALLLPAAGLAEAEAVAARVEQEVRGHSAVRYAVSECRPGDDGEDVVASARRTLRAEPAALRSDGAGARQPAERP